MGNGGKMRDCSVNPRFYSSVTVALCRTVSHRALRASSFQGESFSLSQQCYFLQAAHFHRVGDAGIIKCWLKRMYICIFCSVQIENKKTNQTNRASESQPPPVARARHKNNRPGRTNRSCCFSGLGKSQIPIADLLPSSVPALRLNQGQDDRKLAWEGFSVADVVQLGASKQDELNLSLST